MKTGRDGFSENCDNLSSRRLLVLQDRRFVIVLQIPLIYSYITEKIAYRSQQPVNKMRINFLPGDGVLDHAKAGPPVRPCLLRRCPARSCLRDFYRAIPAMAAGV